MNNVDIAHHDTRTVSHASMVASWRTGHAVPVSPRITEYVRYDEAWWRRSGRTWESIPDGPFALILTIGRNRLEALTGGVDAGGVAADGLGRRTGRDPWSIGRDRLRMGGTCSRTSKVWN